jgi:hypothetical protein
MTAPAQIRCDWHTCNQVAVGHHAPSCTNLCEQHFAANERQFRIPFTRKPPVRTYKTRDFDQKPITKTNT